MAAPNPIQDEPNTTSFGSQPHNGGGDFDPQSPFQSANTRDTGPFHSSGSQLPSELRRTASRRFRSNRLPSKGIPFDTKGVSVYHLESVFLEQIVLEAKKQQKKNRKAWFPHTWVPCNTNPLTRQSSLYEIENLYGPSGLIRQKGEHMRCPLDTRWGAAYVHCLSGEDHVGEATHFLSYCWSNNIGDIVNALCAFCDDKGLDPTRTYVWMDALCLNQHRVVELAGLAEAGKAAPVPESDLHTTFEEYFTTKMPHMLALVSPWKAPTAFSRMWWIYEVVLAAKNDCKIDFLMPPEQVRQLHQELCDNTSTQGIDSLFNAINSITVEKSIASVGRDKNAILERLRTINGLATINTQMRDRLRHWLRCEISNYAKQQRTVLVAQEEDLADFLSVIGETLARLGFYDDAMEQHMAALSCQRDLLLAQADYDGALQEFEKALAGEGDAHPDTTMAASASSIERGEDLDGTDPLQLSKAAMTLFESGDAGRAMKKYYQALNLLEGGTETKTNREQIATVYNNIGTTMDAKDDTEGALLSFEQALALHDDKTKKSLNLAATYYNISYVFRKQEKYGEALRHLQKCLQIEEGVLGKESEKCAMAWNQIGILLYQAGDYSQSLEAYDKCLTIQRSVLGKDHSSLAATYANIAATLESEGSLDMAIQSYQKSLKIDESVLGKGHLDTAETYYSMGGVHKKKGDMDEALRMTNQGQEIVESSLGIEHERTAEGYRNIALLQDANNEFNKALDSYCKCLFIQESVLGTNNAEVASTYLSIGGLLMGMGDIDGALEASRNAASIRVAVLGRQDPKTVAACKVVSFVEARISKGKKYALEASNSKKVR